MKDILKWKSKRMAVRAGFALFIALVIYAGTIRLDGNFHEILPGELYRSAQLTTTQLIDYSQQYNIKTIINLRGDNSGAAWYDTELAMARQLGITHIDFSMSASSGLTLAQAAQLITVLKQAQKPLLIHCRSGADRTGLVAALYLAALKGVDEEDAEEQISIWYGHISLPIIEEYAIDRSWEKMETWVKHRHS